MNSNLGSYFNTKSIIGITGGSIVVIIAAVFLFMPGIIPNDLKPTDSESKTNPVVAEINGQEIRLDEVKETVDSAMTQGQRLDSITALDRIITKTLLLEEAQQRDISVTVNDASDELTTMYEQNGLTEEQFDERLNQLGVTYDQTLQLYHEQLIINEMLAVEVANANLEVTDEEANVFFEENIEMIQSQLGSNVNFEQIESQIQNTVLQQKQQQFISEFIEDLRGDATILTYQDRL